MYHLFEDTEFIHKGLLLTLIFPEYFFDCIKFIGFDMSCTKYFWVWAFAYFDFDGNDYLFEMSEKDTYFFEELILFFYI